MNETDFSKIFLKKNNEGKTTKVVIKKVQKKIRIKVVKKKENETTQVVKAKETASQGNKTNKPVVSPPAKTTTSPTKKNNVAKSKNRIVIARKKKDTKGKPSFNSPSTTLFSPKRHFNKTSEENSELNSQPKKEVSEFAGVPSEIDIPPVISIKNLSLKLNLKAGQVIKKLFQLGVKNLTVNDTIDGDSAQIVCQEFGCTAKITSLLEQTKVNLDEGDPADYVKRAPIVTVMGHVDHGKTTLLDTIRSSKITTGESGGITQHIGGYKVNTPKGNILFIDTPGHSAFSAMRSRGANITDIVVLVVSAVDGIMPQTIEAINHAKQAKVPIIVAINKIDQDGINLELIKKQLSEHEIISQEWGGETVFCEISALKNIGIDKFLDEIIKLAEKIDIKGNPKIPAYGYVLESEIKTGFGNTVTVVIKNGILRESTSYLCGRSSGKIRAFFDENNKRLKEAGPSSIVKIIGLESTEPSGELFQLMLSEKEAKKIVEKREILERENKSTNVKKINLSSFSSVADVFKESQMKELNVIVKADTFGSSEAIKVTLAELKNNEIKANIIHSGVGVVTENDINLARAGEAEIIAFKIKTLDKAKKLAKQFKIKITTYDIIYKIIDDIKESLTGRLDDEINEKITGVLEVKEIFKISQVGKIAGCIALQGKINKKDKVKVIRDDKIIYRSEIESLRRFKDVVNQISEGMECGVNVKNYQDLKVGDKIESYQIEKIEKVFTT